MKVGFDGARIEYNNFKLTVTGYAGAGYRIEIAPRDSGDVRRTQIYRELSNAIDEAKTIVNAQIN